MAKFGASAPLFTIGKTKWGLCHFTRSSKDGALIHCRRNPATCKYCAEHGVPQNEPDPFDVASKLLTDHWSQRWVESNRHRVELQPDQVWPADGIHILAVDDETGQRTVIASFGENDTAMGTISALVAAHNVQIGRPD